MKLHLGCGTVYLKGYVNIDGAPNYTTDDCPSEILEWNATEFDKYYKQDFGTMPNCVVADLEHDLRKRLPFQNSFVDEIVMYQVLEHVPSYDTGNLLSDIARVLKIGGAFIVSVPDIRGTAELLVNAKTDEEEDWAIRLIHGTQRNQWSHHFCGYTARTLKILLAQYGFGGFEDMPKINFYPVVHLKAIKER
jgi:SAM-dependent methyltransferase